MNSSRVVSGRIPYVPIAVTPGSGGPEHTFEALVDTGYTGYVVVPEGSFGRSASGVLQLTLQLAAGSRIAAPAYRGRLRIGTSVLQPIVITELGDEAIIGMSVLRSFTLTIDHGHTLSIEA